MPPSLAGQKTTKNGCLCEQAVTIQRSYVAGPAPGGNHTCGCASAGMPSASIRSSASHLNFPCTIIPIMPRASRFKVASAIVFPLNRGSSAGLARVGTPIKNRQTRSLAITSMLTPNGKAERPAGAARLAPRAHTVFQRPAAPNRSRLTAPSNDC